MKISVCMAAFNGGLFLESQLKSILDQLPSSPEEAEVLISDDGSTDNTLKIIEGFKDPRIHLLPFKGHVGVVKNFERALNSAKGEYIFLADQDDLWISNKVRIIVDKLNEYDFVMHNAFILKTNANKNASNFNKTLNEIRPYRKGILNNWYKNSYTGCCLAFKKQVLKKALPFPQKIPMHDQWLGLIAERYFKVCYMEEPLMYYRIHQNNATHIEKSKAGLLQKIKWRLCIGTAFLSR